MAKPALLWLQRLCALYEKHEPSVYGCTAQPHSSGVLISLELDRGSVHLLAQPKQRSGAYASTASMDIAIHNPPGSGPMPGNGELVVRQFIALLERADKGDVHIKSHGVNSDSENQEIVHANDEEAQQYREEMAGALHLASFLALKLYETKFELLGDGVGNDVEQAHTFLFKVLPIGFSRQAFQRRFGSAPNKVASKAFDILLALSAIAIDGDKVRPTISSAQDLAFFQTFFLSPKQREKAQALWSGEYDPEADYAEMLKSALESDG